MNGEHKIILTEVKELRKDIREIHTRLEKGALTFVTKRDFWKVVSFLFVLISGLASYTIYFRP